VFGGQPLEDQQTLAYYNIQFEATIYLILRLSGGCGHDWVRSIIVMDPVSGRAPITHLYGAPGTELVTNAI
jgi:hypothetical protein